MSARSLIFLVVGVCVGSAGAHLLSQSSLAVTEAELKEARGHQQEFARENYRLSAKNAEVERRLGLLEKSTYDRQEIRSCMLNATILSNAVDAYRFGKPLSDIERGMMSRYMSGAMVATQGRSMQSALSFLLEEQRKVNEECLDGARLSADPMGKFSAQPAPL